jgi:hypothetical protein
MILRYKTPDMLPMLPVVLLTGPPLAPTNVTLVCGTFPVELSWISNFNGGDSQTFKISYSTIENSPYEDVEIISDKGYGILHSYTPSTKVQGPAWFTVTASNKLGNSTSDAVFCIVQGKYCIQNSLFGYQRENSKNHTPS